MYPTESTDTGRAPLLVRLLGGSRRSETTRGRVPIPVDETYLYPVTSPDARRRLWAQFVRRACDQAKYEQGLSIPQIAEKASISPTATVSPATIYRWLNGQWSESPEGDKVELFCNATGMDTADAFKILHPGKSGKAVAAEPIHSTPDVDTIQRKLNDPAVSEGEKTFLRESLRMLALRGK